MLLYSVYLYAVRYDIVYWYKNKYRYIKYIKIVRNIHISYKFCFLLISINKSGNTRHINVNFNILSTDVKVTHVIHNLHTDIDASTYAFDYRK